MNSYFGTMNYLAHIYLSGSNEQVAIGNFIADGIRGKRYTSYSKDIQAGILLHRKIDSFTDAHPIVRQSTQRLHQNHSHYSGVIVDIIYDHFLAKNWQRYSDVPLERYVQDFYQTLERYAAILPSRIHHIIPHMTQQNWLLSYAKVEGIQRVLKGMDKRTKFASQMYKATNELKHYYSEFEVEFTAFFEELMAYSEVQLRALQQSFKEIK